MTGKVITHNGVIRVNGAFNVVVYSKQYCFGFISFKCGSLELALKYTDDDCSKTVITCEVDGVEVEVVTVYGKEK